MLLPTSSEFVAICKAQILLLTQALGASISIVYLTQELAEGEEPRLIPIAAYPEGLGEPDRQRNFMLLPVRSTPPDLEEQASKQTPVAASEDVEHPDSASEADYLEPPLPPKSATSSTSSLVEQRQIVLPLVFEQNVFGLLVTRRDDRAWEKWEHTQVEEIARTLSLACVMDQRYQWEQHERAQERLILHQQHDLLDNLLHQFRNSLTALQTFGKLILRRLAPGDRSHELAANITRETDRLRDLAQQMEIALETGLINSPKALPPFPSTTSFGEEKLGDAILDSHPVPLLPAVGLLPGADITLERCLVDVVLEPLLASARTLAQEKQLEIYIDFREELPPIWGNPKALREAFNNLLENAIKYTPAGGRIWITAEEREESPLLEISVSDTGMGIPPEDLPHLFERHFRGVQAQGDIPGSGLGLAITRSLIEQMHGKIQVFSPALTSKRQIPGLEVLPATTGTTFLVQLPIAVEREPVDA